MITYLDLEAAIARWATERPDVRAVLVIGSRAQKRNPVDQFSDLDLVVFTTHPGTYDRDAGWLPYLGEIWLAVRDRTGHGDREWLVLFEGGIKADFVIAPATRGQGLHDMLEQSVYVDVFRRGVRVLAYENSAASREGPQLDAPESRGELTEVEFELGVNRFILATARAAKFLRRRDLWRTQQQINVDVKRALLVLIEWQARSRRPDVADVWYDGRFIEAWADPRVVRSLPRLFAAYDESDLHEALIFTLDLSEWLMAEIARSLETPFPSPGQAGALSWIRDLLV